MSYVVSIVKAYGYAVMYRRRAKSNTYLAQIFNTFLDEKPVITMTTKKELGYLQHRVLDWCKEHRLDKGGQDVESI